MLAIPAAPLDCFSPVAGIQWVETGNIPTMTKFFLS